MLPSALDPTPLSLLEKLRRPATGDVQETWRRFVQLYTPLLFAWTRRLGVPDTEMADVVQDVFAVLVRELATFRYQPDRRFRGWLWTILRNKWRDRLRHRRAGPPLGNPGALDRARAPDNVAEQTEEEYRTYLVGRALELMKAEFAERDWRACWEFVVSGKPAADVARELGLSVNQVYLAKSRILRRLRAELEGLLD
jgi:RNA polymerase sigma-70 factor (ECF subfamily)